MPIKHPKKTALFLLFSVGLTVALMRFNKPDALIPQPQPKESIPQKILSSNAASTLLSPPTQPSQPARPISNSHQEKSQTTLAQPRFSKTRRAVWQGMSLVSQEYPHLTWFDDTRKKSLQRDGDRAALTRFLESPEVWARAEELLLTVNRRTTSNSGEVARAYQMTALRQAAAIPDNPQREAIATLLERVLTSFPQDPHLSNAQRSALAADRIQAYFILKDHFPQHTHDILNGELPGKTKKLIAYAETHATSLEDLRR